MIERRWFNDRNTADAAQWDIVNSLKARGATHIRLSLKEASKEMIGEGWLVRPDDQGELLV